MFQESIIEFGTDTATLAIFDPSVLMQYQDAEADWWCNDFTDIPEVSAGQITLVGLGSDGFFKIRVTSDKITDLEKSYAREVLHTGVKVNNNKIFVGQAEALPGGGYVFTDDADDYPGQFIEIANGDYDIEIYSLDAIEMRYAVDESDIDKVMDIVAVIKPRTHAFKSPVEEPNLFNEFEKFLFKDTPTHEKIILAKKGILKVWKTPRTASGYTLVDSYSEIYPPRISNNYQFLLKDMSQLSLQEEIKVKSIEVDEANKIIYFEILDK